jgi:hypothetical protein
MADLKAPAFDPQKFAKWWMMLSSGTTLAFQPLASMQATSSSVIPRRGLLLWNQRWNQTGGPEWKNPCVATDYCRVRSLPPQPASPAPAEFTHRNLKNARQLRAFAIKWTVSGLPIWQIEGLKRRKSLAACRNIPVFGRPALETGSMITTAWRETQSLTVTGDAVIDGPRGVAIRAHPRNLG